MSDESNVEIYSREVASMLMRLANFIESESLRMRAMGVTNSDHSWLCDHFANEASFVRDLSNRFYEAKVVLNV